jgi:hypothetical protein
MNWRETQLRLTQSTESIRRDDFIDSGIVMLAAQMSPGRCSTENLLDARAMDISRQFDGSSQKNSE